MFLRCVLNFIKFLKCDLFIYDIETMKTFFQRVLFLHVTYEKDAMSIRTNIHIFSSFFKMQKLPIVKIILDHYCKHNPYKHFI